MTSQRRKAGLAGLATAALIPALAVLPPTPVSQAATALFAEGATRPAGEAQTGFGGAFCEQNLCRTMGRGAVSRTFAAQQVQTAVTNTPGDIIIAGYSVGAAGVYDRLREWQRNPAIAPDPARVVLVVTFGNPENKYGGANRRNQNTGLPATMPYEHLDVSAQYDRVSDMPTRFGIYSYLNTAIGGRHFSYFDGLDINDPNNLVFEDGGTTYMLIPAETLPLIAWMKPFVSEERFAELDARYRPLVERDYDRPAYVPQGEGADWGNGNPPPSLGGTTGQPQQVTNEVSRATVDSASVAAPQSTRSAKKKTAVTETVAAETADDEKVATGKGDAEEEAKADAEKDAADKADAEKDAAAEKTAEGDKPSAGGSSSTGESASTGSGGASDSDSGSGAATRSADAA